MKAGVRLPKRCAGGGDQAAARRQSRHGVHLARVLPAGEAETVPRRAIELIGHNW
jgi:hypothetical protein